MMIHYKGKDYETRQITIRPYDVAVPVTVAKEELWEAIKERASVDNSDEMAIDSHICYYCDDEEWALDDVQFVDLLESL